MTRRQALAWQDESAKRVAHVTATCYTPSTTTEGDAMSKLDDTCLRVIDIQERGKLVRS
jgi:hypothetical protein